MKVSLNWLKDYVQLDAPIEEISRAVTFVGLEVEGIIRTGAPKLENVFVGEVLTRDKHPNADKLSVCTVDVGPAGGVKTIVCGAQNYKVGDRVPVALPGAVLPGDFTIKQAKVRGQLSDGMMCSAKELGVAEDAAGLLILTDRPALGTPINEYCLPAKRSSTSRPRPTATAASWRCASPCPFPIRRRRRCASTTWSRSACCTSWPAVACTPGTTLPWSASTMSPTPA